MDKAVIEEIMIKMIDDNKSVAPRDVVFAILEEIGGNTDKWQKHLPQVKHVSLNLCKAGELVFIRKAKQVSPTGLKGVYRLARPGVYPMADTIASNQTSGTTPDQASNQED